jgi:hypothetical protein
MANIITPPDNWGQPVKQVAVKASAKGKKPKPNNNVLRITSALESMTANIIAKYSRP